MNWPLAIIMGAIGLTLVWMAIKRLRQLRLKDRYALLFTFAGLPFLLLAVWPGAIGTLSRWMGIDYRTLQTIIVAVFLILVVLELLSIVSVQDRKINTLAQEVGILKEKLKAGESRDGTEARRHEGKDQSTE
jgi:hypothetical protein